MLIELSGDPRPAPRPRLSNGHAYVPQWYTAMKRAWAWEARAQMAAGGWEPLDKAQRVGVAVTFRRATRGKADADNLAKSWIDSANGILFGDDAQIDYLSIYVERGAGKARAGVTACVWELRPRVTYVPIAPGWVGV